MKNTLNSVLRYLASDSLRGRLARSGVFLTAGTVVERGFRLVRQIVLAKLVVPEQLGLVAICIAVLAMFEAAGEVGIRFSVIQNKIGDQYGYLNAAWWFQTLRGVVLTVLGVAAAGWIARFYEEPALTNVLRVAFLAVIFNALVSPGSHVLEKRLHFGKYVVLTQGSLLAGTVLTIVLAFLFRNVWAVIIGFSAEGVIRFILSFIICPFVPGFHIDRRAIKELSAFARGMFGMPILTLIAFQADVFVLGKMISLYQVGLYYLAFQLARIPRDLAFQIAGKLLLPVFAMKQDDKESLRRGLCQATRWVTLAVGPLIGFFVSCAVAILVVFYTPAYAEVTIAFMLMVLTAFLRVQGVILSNMYFAIHQLNQQRFFVLLRVIVMGVLLIPLIQKMGFNGAALAVLAGELSGFIFQVITLNRRIQLSSRQYVESTMPGIVLGLVGAVLCWYWMIFRGLEISVWEILGVGLFVMAMGYVAGSVWQFKQLKQLLQHGLNTPSQASGNDPMNEERII